jgi:hypothetical protein
MTVVVFAIVYALVATPWLAISMPLSERWPVLLYPATPFVTVLGGWKLVRWFGFRRVAIPAVVFIVTAISTVPLWMPFITDEDPLLLLRDWPAMVLVFGGLTGWLMAALALLIGPIRMVAIRLR